MFVAPHNNVLAFRTRLEFDTVTPSLKNLEQLLVQQPSSLNLLNQGLAVQNLFGFSNISESLHI